MARCEAVRSHLPCAGRGEQHPRGPEMRFDQGMAPSRPLGDYDFMAECAEAGRLASLPEERRKRSALSARDRRWVEPLWSHRKRALLRYASTNIRLQDAVRDEILLPGSLRLPWLRTASPSSVSACWPACDLTAGASPRRDVERAAERAARRRGRCRLQNRRSPGRLTQTLPRSRQAASP